MFTRRLALPAERGALLDTLVFHELRAQIAYSGCGGGLSYYRTPAGTEVDFVWRRGALAGGIEVKASRCWRPEHGRGLAELHRAGVVTRCCGVYLGDSALQDGPIRVLPLRAFLGELSGGRVLAGARQR